LRNNQDFKKIMNKKARYLIVLALISILLIPFLTLANRGMIVPRTITILEETGQNAIVAWNGDEEVIILSTDVKSSEYTLVLEVLPLPSNPTKVEEGSFDSFTKLTEIVNKKAWAAWAARKETSTLGIEKRAVPGIEITFHKKIGAHEVTVVKVDDLDYFLNWVRNFIINKGFEYKEISPEFKDSVTNYLNRGIKFFVFDVIETSENKQSIKPLIYRFKTDFLYYPLEITATSDAGWSSSKVNIFLITKGTIDASIVRDVNLWPGAGFDYNIELNKKELKEISPELADLFKSDPLVMNAYYYGTLSSLNKDLVVYRQDIRIPTFFEKVSQTITLSPVFQYISPLWKGLMTATSIMARVFMAGLLLSLIVGILSIFFIIATPIKRLLGKFNFKSTGYKLISYLVSAVVVIFLLSWNVMVLTAFIFVILTVMGFAMIIFLIIKLLKNIF